MNLQNLSKQIKEKSLAASDDLKDATNSTRPMREGNKRAAQSALNDLNQEYRRLLLKKASYIVVSGPQAKDLEEAVKGEKLPFIVNPDGFYEELLSKIDERAYMNRTVDGTFFNALSHALEEVSRDMGIQSYPQLLFKAEYAQVISNKNQVTDILKKVINTDVGGELLGIYAVHKILDRAIASTTEDSFSPIILTAEDTGLAISLSNDLRRLSNNVFLVSVGKNIPKSLKSALNSLTIKEANKETVDELLQAIRSRTV